jgi:hypothetical protein
MAAKRKPARGKKKLNKSALKEGLEAARSLTRERWMHEVTSALTFLLTGKDDERIVRLCGALQDAIRWSNFSDDK